MSFKTKTDILPPGLKTRPGINENQRLPSISSLVSSFKESPLAKNVLLTRGGVAKRTFKPNIPSERNKKINKLLNDDEKQNICEIKTKFNKKDKLNFKNKKNKDFIQLEGNLEGFKADLTANKNKNIYYNKNFVETQNTSINSKKSKFKLDLNSKDEKVNQIKNENLDISELMSSDEDMDEKTKEDGFPICLKNYMSLLNESENKEENEDIEKKLEKGRLILMPCIFGKLSGDTGYKMQILKSGKIRLVNKKTGFIIDLLNTGGLKNDGYKEVVELDNDKLLRYGTIKNEDIYLPIRNLNSNYDYILDD